MPAYASAFAVKFTSLGQVIYSTYLGSNGETASAVAADASGSAYVTGEVIFPTFPAQVVLGNLSTFADGAFVAKLHPAGCALRYYTYVGGSSSTFPNAVAVDAAGDAYITGGTVSPDFPTVNAIQASCIACQSPVTSTVPSAPFVFELGPTGSQLIYSTYLSGLNSGAFTPADQGTAIAVDSAGNTYVAGHTSSASFPTANAVQTSFGGQEDAFVAKLNPTNVPSIVLNPPRLSFGTQVFGTTSAPQTVTLTNQSASVIDIRSITFSENAPPVYSETNDCGMTIPAGKSCIITVTFTPAQMGAPVVLLAINDNGFGPHEVPLYGAGVPPPNVVLSTGQPLNPLTFGSAQVGVAGGPVAVLLSNNGGSPLNIASIAVAGADFSQTNNCGITLAQNASCTIGITFKPTATGNRTGTLTLTDNAPDSPQQVQLSGTGLDFALSTSSASATISPGQQAKWTVTVTPAGGLTGAVSLACTGAPVFATCSVSPNSTNLDGTNAVTANVTVTTTAGSRLVPWRNERPPWARGLRGVTLGLVVLMMILAAAAATRKRRLAWVAITLSLLLAILMASCGGGGGGGGGGPGPTHNPGTPAGTYTLTITATVSVQAGLTPVNVIHTTPLTLTVQ